MKEYSKKITSAVGDLSKGKKTEIGGGIAGAGIGLKIGGLGLAGGFGAFGIPALAVAGCAAGIGVGAVYLAKKGFKRKTLL